MGLQSGRNGRGSCLDRRQRHASCTACAADALRRSISRCSCWISSVEGRPGVPDRQLWVPVGPGYVCGSPHFWRQLGVPDTSVTFLDPGYHQKAFCGSRSLSRRTWVPGCRRVERGSPHRGVRQGLDTSGGSSRAGERGVRGLGDQLETSTRQRLSVCRVTVPPVGTAGYVKGEVRVVWCLWPTGPVRFPPVQTMYDTSLFCSLL